MKYLVQSPNQSHLPRFQRSHLYPPEPSQEASGWSPHDGHVDGAGLSDAWAVVVVVAPVMHDAGLSDQWVVVQAVLGGMALLHHPSRWQCRTMHALGASMLQHTSGRLDRVAEHSDCTMGNQVHVLCLRTTKMCRVSTKNKQRYQARWRKRAEGQQQTSEPFHICKLARPPRKPSSPIALLMRRACSTISASMMT